MNDATAVKEYSFSDGTKLCAEEHALLFLPKDCEYTVKSLKEGGSYEICYEMQENVWEKPFTLKFRNYHDILKIFKETADAWQQAECNRTLCIKNVYEIILYIEKELIRTYMPNSKEKMINSAIEEIQQRFKEADLSVSDLARSCQISEAYFRRLFFDKMGANPREYITGLRIRYARQMLQTGEKSISEVAISCGYEEISSFSREFTRRMGITPSEYRKKYQN